MTAPLDEAHQPIPSRHGQVPATVDPTVYAGRVLAQELNKARFLQGSALFLSTPGVREEFASRFGPEPGTAASAA
ncbi:hypothetical protein ACWGQ5_07620 [Streptomyces sp. NPDC055722]